MSGRIDELSGLPVALNIAVQQELQLEREACAALCEKRAAESELMAMEKPSAYYSERAIEARFCAAAIRRRGQ